MINTLLLAAQLATVAGCPDATQSFVSRIVVDSFTFVGHVCEVNATTELYSILERGGVKRAMWTSVLTDQGATDVRTAREGLYIAAAKAPIVLFTLGGPPEINDEFCDMMESQSDAAFVVAAGKSGYDVGEGSEPHCAAGNILRVAALSADGHTLLPSSNFGATIRIAAPGENIPVVGAGGAAATLTGTTAPAAEVAARLVATAEANPTLHGAVLISRFLETETVADPALKGKVDGARALRESR